MPDIATRSKDATIGAPGIATRSKDANRLEAIDHRCPVEALDPITARPQGHAYADFGDESSAELVLQGDGKPINGQPIRVFFEIPFQLEHPAD